MNTENAWHLESLRRFLRQSVHEGLLNPAAARAQAKAIEHLEAELDEDEIADVRRIDLDALRHRFHSLEGSSIRPEVLALYLSRFADALAEYRSWLEDPARFIGTRRERARAWWRGSEQSAEEAAAERVAMAIREVREAMIPVPLREEVIVWIANLPADLTPAEAERIAKVVRAYVPDPDPDPGA
ncbi:MAG: hypothetical protein Kow0020_06450 [Wenzhouxiangellaceae bacterium]